MLCVILNIVLMLLNLSNLETINGLSATKFRGARKSASFTFSDDLSNHSINTTENEVLPRNLISGLVPNFLVPNFVVPNFVAPYMSAPVSHCICVPPGSCPQPITPPPLNDGSGQIDIRIVNKPMPPPTTASPFTCSYGLASCCQAGSYQCGRRYPAPPGSTPPGEGQAYFGEYPWQVALLNEADVYLGSGALISAQHVLTAAHKVSTLSPMAFKVRVGEWDASNKAEPVPAMDVDVGKVFVHPNFNKLNLQNDVAVIRLSTPVNLATRSTVGTVCLPTATALGQRCYVAGWGKNDFGPTGAYQAIQRKVDVPLVPNGNCQAALRTTRLGVTFMLNNASFICAGGEAGKDACTGDGGSPLVCENNGVWYVVGLVAWGIGCAAGGIPGVYVNVATYLPWIQTILAA